MTAIAHPPEYYAGLNWPVDKFPALKPQDFPDDRSFSVLRRSEEQLKADAKDDEDVRVFWKQCPTRDGKEISILFYEPIKRQRNESRLPLIVAIHGGGKILSFIHRIMATLTPGAFRLGNRRLRCRGRIVPKGGRPAGFHGSKHTLPIASTCYIVLLRENANYHLTGALSTNSRCR